MSKQFSIDALRFSLKGKSKKYATHSNIRMIKLSMGNIRILDTKKGKETILIIPDGPNIIEHYFSLLDKLKKSFRVIIFDLPGFGFSTHNGSYDYSLNKTNQLILELLDLIQLPKVNIVFPCAGGFYGLSFTQAYPEKVNHLILIQTPSFGEMKKWTQRIVPNYLKKPYFGQLLMPFLENKFAEKWYDYALPKAVDGTKYKSIALKGIKDGGTYCLCSLTQGISVDMETDFKIDSTISLTLVHGTIDFTHKGTNFESIRQYHAKAEIIAFEQCGHFPDLEQEDKFTKLLKEKIR